jgi:hypothetical protein
VYCASLAGYSRLKEDREAIISDLSLSDYNLQDAIMGADKMEISERQVNGETFIDYSLYGYFGAIFAAVTIHTGRQGLTTHTLLGST